MMRIESATRRPGLTAAGPAERKVRILIVDDHPLMRVGIAAILQAQPEMEVVGEAGTAAEAMEVFARVQPEITLMDLRLPGGSGLDAIRGIRAAAPEARIIVLTTYEGDEDIHQALQAGAMGYLIKGMSHEVLIRAVRRVYGGNRFLPPPVANALSSRTPESELSERERQVLSLLVRGKSNREIAQMLQIKEATVKTHVSAILMRLDVVDRTQAVVEALKRGLDHL